jgi:hypothetical protein
LALAGAFQFLRQLGIHATTLFQNGSLLGQVLRRGAGRRTVLAISLIEAGQIVDKPLIRPLNQPFQLLAGEVAIGAVDRLQPGAGRALEYLQKIADEWDKEYHGQTKQWAETPHGQRAWKRLATIEEWVILIDIDRIQISDIEPKAE